jgi:hypothetical protein
MGRHRFAVTRNGDGQSFELKKMDVVVVCGHASRNAINGSTRVAHRAGR